MQFIIALLCAVGQAPASDAVRPAVERSLPYLTDRAVAWKNERNCATCHHVPMMIWTLNEAKVRGFTVDEEALASMTAWVAQEDNAAQITRGESSMPGGNGLDLTPVLTSMALAAAPAGDDATRAAQTRFALHIMEKQAADASWPSPAGRPPMLAVPAPALTAVALAALEGAALPPDVEAKRIAAQAWLAAALADETNQGRNFRLLMHGRQGEPAPQALVEQIFTDQRDDGGWSQTPEMESDAFATGQTLCALSVAGVEKTDPHVARAVEFLIRTQREDGSWPMLSRPMEGEVEFKEGTEPITYAATAWAVLGMLNSRDGSLN